MRKGLLDELRDTSLEVVAGFAESAARATQHFDRGPAPRSDEPRSDFLYDVVRLHLTHLNELARLGAAYSFLPARILERLYSGAGGCPPADCRPQEGCSPRDTQPRSLDREAMAGDVVTFSIPLRNGRFNPQMVHIDRPAFKDVATGKQEQGLVARIFVDGKNYDPDFEFQLVQTATVQVRVTVGEIVAKDVTFESRVKIRFSDADSQDRVLRLHTLG